MRKFIVLTLLALCSLPALALPNDLDAVIQSCGKPTAESRETSQVTNHLQRTLIYGDLMLHFEADGAGWGFTSGWQGHFPLSRYQVADKMPCFQTAMQQAAASAPAVDPTTAAQTKTQSYDSNSFGIPHFWVIAGLIILLVLGIAIPSARQRKLARQESENAKAIEEAKAHAFRKPHVDEEQIKPRHQHIDPDMEK